MKENSVIPSSVTPTAGQQILTLSTCTPAGDKEHRFVVNAVLISENHTFEKIKDSISVTEEPVMSIAEEIILSEENTEQEVSQPEEMTE